MKHALARALFALLLAIVPLSAGASAGCDRVIAVGDLHGAYDGFVTILEAAGLVDDDLEWTGEGSCLVQLGDIVDRGARSRELLDLLIDLESQAPDSVHVLLGNHEIMNILGDLREVVPGEFAAYAEEETEQGRRTKLEVFLKSRRSTGADEDRLRAEFEIAHPPGWFAHRRAFAPEGRYGGWLLKKPIVKMIDGTLYVHGGISPADAKPDFERMNRSVIRDVKAHLRARDRLIEAGVITELTSLVDALGKTLLWLENFVDRESPPWEEVTAVSARRFAAVTFSDLLREDGPLWYRELALADEQAFEPELEKILEGTGAVRIVVGHTPTASARIQSRFDGRVFAIDTGAGPAYGGQPSALEVAKDGRVRAIYPDHVEVLVGPQRDDAFVEAVLREGEVLESRPIGSGITQPDKVLLEYRGHRMHAAFKSADIDLLRQVTVGGKPELHFTDRYVYERAAYLLDRRLGLNMVPVTVIREIDGVEGALVAWIDNAINENERMSTDWMAQDPLRITYQRSVMRLFDALIHNIDRNISNQLYTLDDRKLYLIDHSRSFRLNKRPSGEFMNKPASLPRSLWNELGSLEFKELRELMRGVLSKAQIKALLARRDAILKKIERDRAEFSDAIVFQDGTPYPF
jgi:hypothetical protein